MKFNHTISITAHALTQYLVFSLKGVLFLDHEGGGSIVCPDHCKCRSYNILQRNI